MGSYRPAPGPEILPPVPDHVAPQPVHRPRPSWAVAPATYLLVGINCAVFVFMLLKGAGFWNPSPEVLFRYGADNAGAVLYGYVPYFGHCGQWWRIVTAMFIHVGILHLATNMWCLWNLGLLAEPLLGSFGVFAAYILTGAAGNLLSTAVNWYWYRGDPLAQGHELFGPIGAGASGAVFGIAGALIVLLKSPLLPVPVSELKRLRRSVIYFAAINLIIGFSISGGAMVAHAGFGIDNMAHVGGFTSGLLFAVPLVPRIGSPRDKFTLQLRMAVGMIAGILVLFGFFLSKVAS
jgi:rhomboid protease GluP